MRKPSSRFPWIVSKKKKVSLPPPTTTMTPTLPDDVVAEILSYLPPKTTCKFKLVSKSWHRLISHPSLISSLKQRRLADRPPSASSPAAARSRPASSRCPPPPPRETDLSSLHQPTAPNIPGSNNPFIQQRPPLIGSSAKLIVWDPVTRDSASIVPLSWLECDYGLSATDPTSFDIVGVSQIGAVPCFHSVPISIVYSSRTKRWASLFAPRHVDVRRYLNPVGPASVGRSLYWLQHGSILALNMRRRVTRLIALPREDMVVGYGNVWFGRVGENLCLVYVSDEKNMEVWQLEKYGRVKRWKKVMEAKGDRWGLPEFFDGRRIAFSSPIAKGCEMKGCKKIEFYDTCCEGWQGSINYRYTDSADTNHCSVPYYL
ncbi:uncharacterized protein A4U43_C05F34200 [Asparagus officinalis]|uniref:F-box domain-containing protein n=1 Tax=Asparagus officinalis TaxID=4686 RepID=A0A5P1EWM7_ASPOF|nr:uncharacterized protein A4U43_C05F34200 [Asparagus officinalis]